MKLILVFHIYDTGFPGGSDGKETACNAGDLGWIPGSGKSSGEENGNPLQYSHLENPMDREAWQATVHGIIRVRHDLATKPPPPQYYFRTKPYGLKPGERAKTFFRFLKDSS